jgi:hypothetical protein
MTPCSKKAVYFVHLLEQSISHIKKDSELASWDENIRGKYLVVMSSYRVITQFSPT